VQRTSSAVVLVLACAVLWLFADLFLRMDLPGAGLAISGTFEACAALASWLVEEPSRGIGAAASLALVLVPLLIPGTLASRLALPGGLVATALLVAVVGLGGLMERGVFLGLVAAGVVGWRLEARPAPRLGLGIALLACAGSAVWLLRLLEARSSSYLPLRWMADLGDFRWPVLVLAAGVGALALWLRRGDARRLAMASVAAAAVCAMAVPLLDPTGWWTPLLALLLAPAAASAAPAFGGWSSSSPATWPTRFAPLAALGFVLVVATYGFRTFGCPVPDAPGLVRMADAGPVFRVALSEHHAVFALRDERRFGVLSRAGGAWSYSDPTALPRSLEAGRPGQSHASVEELLFDGDRFVGTALGGHPDFYSTEVSPANTVNNLVVGLPADGAAVDEAWGVERLCWIGALAAVDEGVLAGCEYEPALHLLRDGAVVDSLESEDVGDVAALALEGGSAWSVSFWKGSAVARYGLSPLRIEASRRLGGMHYDVAVDAARDRLFASAYTGSRVRVLSAEDLSDVATIPTGFGARALAVDPSRGLVLVSSVYDGVITVASSEGDVRRRLRVGGHVKDIALDPAAGEAWFASRCGVFRLDLDSL
jgi:hypothetical protein